MTAYLLGQVFMYGTRCFASYVERTTTSIERHGGQVLAVVQAVEVMEGDWPNGALTAIVRSPEGNALHAYRNIPGNRLMKDIRHHTATGYFACCVHLEA